MKLRRHIQSKFTLTVFFGLISFNAFGLPVDFNRLEHAVTRYIQQQDIPLKRVRVSLTSLNKQLQLKPCNQELNVSMAPGSRLIGHTSLSVSCASPQPWRIHVAAHVDGMVDVFVARHPLTRNSIITDNVLEVKSRRISQLSHGYYAALPQLRHMIAKRNIKAGQVITPGMLKAKKLVIRGQSVTILAEHGNLNLSAKGKALMDGRQGQTIKVKNLASKKMIYAQVVSNGVVKVNY